MSDQFEQFFLFATFARSFDNYHVSTKNTHLVSSVFYSDYFNIEPLKFFKSSNVHVQYVIRVLRTHPDLSNIDVKFIKHSECLIEIEVSLFYLLSSYFHSNRDFEGLIQQIVGSHNLSESNKDLSNIINNVLFVFDSIDWANLQLLFKSININISGGSVTKRHFISTAHFNLVLFLIKLGYSSKDIYKSFKSSKVYSKLNAFQLELSHSTQLLIINTKLLNFKEMLLDSIKELEKDIFIKQGNVLSLETDISSKQNKKKFKGKKESKNDLKRLRNVADLKSLINDKENEIIKLKSQISQVEMNKSQLYTKSKEEIRELYYNRFHNNKILEESLKLKNLFNLKKLK
jgi:hypothetical protein